MDTKNSKCLLVFVITVICLTISFVPSGISVIHTVLQSYQYPIVRIRTILREQIIINNNRNIGDCNISNYYQFGTIYNCSKFNSDHSKLRIVTATICIGKDYCNDKMYISSHLNYVLINGYTHIKITKSLIYNNTHYSNSQKGFIFYHVITHISSNIDYLLLHDFDILFLNCGLRIDPIINFTQHLYKNINKNKKHLIFSADHNGVNSGVLLFKYSKWSIHFMNKWYQILDTVNKTYKFDRPGFADQTAFTVLITRFKSFKMQFMDTKIKHKDNNKGHYAIDYDRKYFQRMPGPNNIEDLSEVKDWYNKYLLNDFSKNNVAIIPSLLLNNVIAPKKIEKENELPLLVHFAGKKKSHNDIVYKYQHLSTC